MLHPPVIDGFEFARAGASLRGTWPLAEFARLRDALHEASGEVSWVLEGIPEAQGRPSLRLSLEATLPLVCQRCLEPLQHPLRLEALLQLAASQGEIDAEPLAAEGPERIVAGREMQVRDMIEDELVLALPIAPRHARCTGVAGSRADAPASPFADLRRRVQGLKH